jgi:hypothetical protein
VLDWISTFSSLTPGAFFTETVWSQRTTFKMDAMVFRPYNQMVHRYLEHYFMTRLFCSVLESFLFIVLEKNHVYTKMAWAVPSLMLSSLTLLSLDLKLKRSSFYRGILLLQSALSIRGIMLLTAMPSVREN